jgi:hypothetical protein
MQGHETCPPPAEPLPARGQASAPLCQRFENMSLSQAPVTLPHRTTDLADREQFRARPFMNAELS